VRPSGLFTSLHIFASSLFAAIPPLAVSLVFSSTSALIFYPKNILPSSESKPLSFKYVVTSKSTSSKPSDSEYKSY